MQTENNTIELVGTLVGHQNPIYTLALSEMNPNILFTAGNDKGVVEWDLEQMQFRRILCKVGSSVYCLYAIPNTNILAIGMRSGQLLLVDTENQRLVANLQTEKGAIFSIKSIPGKNELIGIGEEGYAYVWSLERYKLLYRFKVSDTTVRVIAVKPEGDVIAFGDKNGELYLFNASDFQKLTQRKLHDLPVTSLQFVPNEKLLSGGRDAKLFVLDFNLNPEQELIPHMFTVYGIALQEERNLFATISRDKSLKVWSLADLKLIKNISRDRGYDSHYLSINAFLWNANRLITVSDDKTVKVWTEVLP